MSLSASAEEVAPPEEVTPARRAVATLAFAGAALAFDPRAASATTPKVALMLLVALVLVAPDLPRRWRGVTSPPPGGVVMALLLGGWQLLTLAWSPRPDMVGAGLWLAVAAIGLWARRLATAERRQLAGRIALLVLAGGSSAIIVQTATGAEGIARHGLMGNPNWLGLSLAAATPLALGHARHGARLERGLSLAALALGAVGLAFAQSRVAIVALVAVASMGAASVAIRHGSRQARPALVTMALGGALGLGALAADGGAGAALVGRLWLARVGLDSWAAAPLLGHGQGGFVAAFLPAQGHRLATLDLTEASRRFVFVTTAHGDWLQLAIEGGLVALLLGLATFLLAIVDLGRRTPAAAASLAVIALCMVGDAPLRQPAVLLIVALTLADTRPLPRRRGRRRLDAALALGATIVLAAVLPRASAQWIAERRASSATDPSGRVVALEAAVALAPWWGAAALDLGLARLQIGDARGALAAFDTASEAGEVGVALAVARGNAWVRDGRPREAVAAYRRALALHPASFAARTNLAEAFRQMGVLDLAREQAEAARRLQPHHPKLAALEEALRRATIDQATSSRPPDGETPRSR